MHITDTPKVLFERSTTGKPNEFPKEDLFLPLAPILGVSNATWPLRKLRSFQSLAPNWHLRVYDRGDQLLDIDVFMCFPHLSSISCVVFAVSLLQPKHMSQEPQVQQGGDLFRLDGFLNAWLSVWPFLVVVIRSRFRTVAAKPGNSDKGILAKWNKTREISKHQGTDMSHQIGYNGWSLEEYQGKDERATRCKLRMASTYSVNQFVAWRALFQQVETSQVLLHHLFVDMLLLNLP